MKLPKATEGSVWYQGRFESPAFKLWGSPAGLAEKVYHILKEHGATPQDFTIEGSAGSSAIVYNVLKSNFIIRIRLDGFEATFNSINLIGAINAAKIGIGCWQAIKDSDNSMDLSQHELTIALQFRVESDRHKEIINAYVTKPKSLPPDTLSGVAFYLPAGQRTGDRGGSIVLDRLTVGADLYLTMRVGMIIDAKQVDVPAFEKYVDDYLADTFSKIGIEIEN
ncbi:MAG: hypothetical protein Q8S00_00985 [Deltaproteobacteria bacterium]|nr:hypothetical protein [Deltaproteobacteria bacterium]MDZ4341385.1 hypothetical protein [Candidatus Binatia bacterium]